MNSCIYRILGPVVLVAFACLAAYAGPVRLAWDPSPDYWIAGYHVYRAGVSGGPYTRLTADPVSGCEYADETAVAGNNYYYVVTAVDAAGNESSFSSELAATIAGYDAAPEPGALLVHTGMQLTVKSGDLVLLSGGHRDPEGKTVAYKWSQVSGIPVAISGSDRAEAGFLAPVVSVDTVLSFALTSTDAAGGSSADLILVTVRKR